MSLIGGRSIAGRVGRGSWSRLSSQTCPLRLLVRFPLESSSDALVPGLHSIIRLVWEALLGQHFGKDIVRLRIYHVILLDRLLQKRHMVLRPKQQLYGLPCHEALLLQRGYIGGGVAVIGWAWLQAVIGAERAVNEGNRGWRCVLEEDVVVAAHVAVPGRDLQRGEVGRLAWFELLALQ
jgi:hypothetical protein